MAAEVYFSGGVIIDEMTVAISSGFLAAPDAATSRIYLVFGEFWAAHDVPHDFIVSLSYSESNSTLYALGRDGIVKSVQASSRRFTYENIRGRFQEQWIGDAQQRGSMSRVRAINDQIYACGWGGQIYRLEEGRWVHFEKGIENARDVHFLDIDGGSRDNLYAVGMNGKTYFCDGIVWRQIEVPTNRHLYSVHAVSADEVYLAGASGTLFRGNKDAWRFIGDECKQENYWSVSKFAAELFVAYGDTGMLRLTRDNLVEVDMGLGYSPTTNRLDSKDGKLWSFGAYDLVGYDGASWQPLLCPDNNQPRPTEDPQPHKRG